MSDNYFSRSHCSAGIVTERCCLTESATRGAILALRDAGHGSRAIARTFQISRNAVKAVLADGAPAPPLIRRAEKAEPHRDGILALLASCKGNLVRVHEELLAPGKALSYRALTGFCRRHGIGHGWAATGSSRAKTCSTTRRRTSRTSAAPTAVCRPPPS
jgi:hypothetical protein